MLLLRSTIFALLFYVGTTVMVFAGLPVALVSRRGMQRYARLWGWLYIRTAHHVLGIRMQVEGPVPASPVFVAAKHESAYETLALLAILPDPIIVLKRELITIPLLGWLMQRHGVIPVDRTASAGALRAMLQAADVAKAEQRVVLIFPEGTRVPHGEAPRLQSGFAGLYARLALPVVPVATDAGVAWPRTFLKRPGVIRFQFGKAIAPGLPRRALEDAVHTAINVLND